MIALTRKKVIGIAIVIVVAIALAVTLPLVMSAGGLGQTTPMSIKGHLVIERNGEVVVDKDNIIVNTGYSAISYYLSSSYMSPVLGYQSTDFDVIGVGDDATGLGVTNVDLEGLQARQAGTFQNIGVGKWKVHCTWGPDEMITPLADSRVTEFTTFDGNAVALVEAGVFNELNSSVVGVMMCRQTFGTITMGAADSLTVTWFFTVHGAI